jgi:hypothetical protein
MAIDIGQCGVTSWPADGDTVLATGAADSRIVVIRPDGLTGVLAITPPR